MFGFRIPITDLYRVNFLYKRYIRALKIQPITKVQLQPVDLHSHASVKKIYHSALWKAGMLGAGGVFLFYLPMYFFSVFQKKISLTIFGFTFDFACAEVSWCALLTFLEIIFLTLVHLRMVHNIAVIAGTLNMETKNEVTNDLFNVATLQHDKIIKGFGLNPFQGISKFLLFLINLLNVLKAVIANKILRYLIQRFSSRYVLKYVLDLAGTPIYVLLNMYITRRIYLDLFASLYGRQVVDNYFSSVSSSELNEEEKELLYDSIQLVVMCKRGFHPNHTYLTKKLFVRFGIKAKKKHQFTDDYRLCFSKAREEVKRLCRDIIVIGFILDGRISYFERRRIRLLFSGDNSFVTLSDLQKAASHFRKGNLNAIHLRNLSATNN
mgnify:CR=1 FL=1